MSYRTNKSKKWGKVKWFEMAYSMAWPVKLIQSWSNWAMKLKRNKMKMRMRLLTKSLISTSKMLNLMPKKKVNLKGPNWLLTNVLRRQKRSSRARPYQRNQPRKKITDGNSQNMRLLPCPISHRINSKEFAKSSSIWINSILTAHFWAKPSVLKPLIYS